MSGPLLLAVESSCDETGVALVEGGRRIHANVVASQIALHAPTGGIVPEVAARAHLRWIVPALDEALGTAGVSIPDVDAVAVTYGPGLAGSLLVGINVAKTLAWAHDKPLVPVNHLEGHVYAGWLLDPGEAEREAPPFPLVALVVSGGHTFLVEMRDHLDVPVARADRRRRRGRGVRQGRAAAGARLSRAGRQSRWRPRGRRRRIGPSRGHGWATRTTSASRGSRRRPAGSSAQARADEGLPADERDGSPARSGRGRARVGVPGLGRGRADDEDDPGGRGGRRARASCSAAAWRRTRPCARASRARRRRAGSRSSSRGRACAPTTGR